MSEAAHDKEDQYGFLKIQNLLEHLRLNIFNNVPLAIDIDLSV